MQNQPTNQPTNNVISSSVLEKETNDFVIDEGNINDLENDYYNAGTVKIKKNLDAKKYKKNSNDEINIDKEDFDKARNYLETKLGLQNYSLYDMPRIRYNQNLNKFYHDFNVSDKKYRLFFEGTNDEYLFADNSNDKLNPNNKEDIPKILSFIKQEYENIKNIELENENILTNNENLKELSVKITNDNNEERIAKIILNPSKIDESYGYSYQFNRQKNIDFLNIDVSFTEIKNKLLTSETIDRINEIIKNKINDNPLYNDDERFVLNDNNIYNYDGYQYVKVYDKNNETYLYVKIKNTKPDLEIDLTEDEPEYTEFNGHFWDSEELSKYNKLHDEETLNFFKSLKLSEYNCYIDENSKYYTLKQGNLSLFDYVNGKLNENEYIDNFEQRNEYRENKENLNLFIFHIKNKTNEETRYIAINLSKPNIINSAYLDNFDFDSDLKLTDENKEDLKTIIKRYAKRNYKKIDIDDNLEKNETGQFYVNITVYFDDNVYIKKEIEIAKSDVYTIGLSPACPPTMRVYIVDYPTYPKGCQRNFKVIINPSLKTTYDLMNCIPNKPETPNEIPKEEKPPIITTPSNIPKESPSELPKENEPPKPKHSTPNKTIPNRNTPSKPTENTPITIVKTDDSVKNTIDNNNISTTLPEINNSTISRDIKTGDNLFNIISLIGTIEMFAYFINLMENKYKHKLN